MRTKVTLVLLFLNVVLFFFIFGFEREWRTERALREARTRVLGPATAHLRELEINSPALATPIRLTREGETWHLTSPIQWPANPHAVSRILHELQFLEHETSFAVADLAANDQSLADYGLAQPALLVTLTPAAAPGESPAREVLAIGSETAVGNRLYVLSPDGTRVHVVNRSLVESLSLTLDQLRSDACFTIPVFEVRSLNIQATTPSNLRVRLRRDGTRWTFEAPILARASRPFTELAINGLNRLQTRRFLGSGVDRPDLLTESGTGNPTLRITLEGNNRRETLLLGREIGPVPPAPGDPADTPPDREFYARMEDRDVIFTVALPAALLESLRGAQEQLRDRRVLDLEGRSLSALTLAAPNQPELTLQRLEPDPTGPAPAPAWQIVGQAGDARLTLPADREIVERLVQRLNYLEAVRFLRDAPSDAELEDWGLVRPARTVTLTLAPQPGSLSPGTDTLTLLLGVAFEQGGRVYARVAHQPFVYLVDESILHATPAAPRFYRERLLRELPPGARLTGLVLTDLATGTTLLEHRLAANQTWDQRYVLEPADRAAALATLRAQVRSLRARRFVFDGFPATVPVAGDDRPWAYRLDAVLNLSGGPAGTTTSSSLFFAERAEAELQLVGSPEFDVVFEAEQDLLDALWVFTYGPRDPGPPATTPPATQ